MIVSQHRARRQFPDLMAKLTGVACNDTVLRRRVLAGLQQLFNTRPGLDEQQLDAYPQIKTSVLCYGVPESNQRRSDARGYASLLQTAIRRFEPRLLADTLRVQALQPPASFSHSHWLFHIQAHLGTSQRMLAFACIAVFDLVDARAVVLRG